ncbi:MAG: hypothetical protein ABR600_07585 [Actinomycetota bacterium]
MLSRRKLALSLIGAITALMAVAVQAGVASAGADDPPAKVDRNLFLRWDLASDGSCGGPAYLSEDDAADSGNTCGRAFLILANTGALVLEDTFTLSMNPREDVPLPITLDASKPLTGRIAISSVHPNAIKFDLLVTLGSTALPVQHVDAGVYTGSWFLDAQSPSFPVNIAIPASLDKTDVSEVKVEVIWKQAISTPELASAWVELDTPSSVIDVPSYDKSWTEYCTTHTC